MQWTQENTLYFISLVRERPVLWDETLRFQSLQERRQKKITAQLEIAEIFGINKEEVGYKWVSLKGQYTREKKREATGYVTKWFAYKTLSSFVPTYYSDESTMSNAEYYAPSPQTSTSSATSFTSGIKRRCSTPSMPATPPPPTTPSPPKTPSPLPPKIMVSALETINRLANESNAPPLDDVAAYAHYVAVQMRKLRPMLQSKLKLEIQTLLCKYELQNIEDSTAGSHTSS